VLSQDETDPWVKSFYVEGLDLTPLEEAPFPHSAGLNFSRSWGLWDLYKQTGKETYRDSYVQHIVTPMESPQYWRDDYKKYSHWVAQLGIYGIGLSLEEDTPLVTQ